MVRELAKSLHWGQGVYPNCLFDNAVYPRFIGDSHRSARAAGILFGHQRTLRSPQTLGSLDLSYLAVRFSHWSSGLLFDLCLVSAIHFLGFETLLHVLGNPFCIRPSSTRSG